MKHMRPTILFALLVLILISIYIFYDTHQVEAPSELSLTDTDNSTSVSAEVQAVIDAKADLITITSPQPGEAITSPLLIQGEARGYWFFEATFPLVLVDWDGRIIAEYYATAEGEWMTEEYVPFVATVEFESPYQSGDPDFMKNGALILKKANASGLPEHDDALEIPVVFR